jgi:hypothetical protein
LGSIDVVKRHSKNDFTHHPTPHTMCPIRCRNMTTVSEMDPTIAVGFAKAQGSKVKPVNGLEPPRATRVRDKATQSIANILAHPMPHRLVPAYSSFVSESRLGDFLPALLWAGI